MTARRAGMGRALAAAWTGAVLLVACGGSAAPPAGRAEGARISPATSITTPGSPSEQVRPPSARIPPETAYLVIDLPSGVARRSAHAEILDREVLPGSIAKVALLAAALETGVVTPRTSLACRRDLAIEHSRLTCVHPDLGRPLEAVDALAHSCNSFFAAIAERVSREALNARRIALGLPAIEPAEPPVLSALGLAGPRVTPRALVRLLPRLVPGPGAISLRPQTREVLLAGLRGAATYGTAAALGEIGVGTLAKTGTAPMPGGGYQGLLVAFRPDPSGAAVSGARVAVLVLAPGASGRDAATIARELLQELPEVERASQVRVGEARPDGSRVVARSLEDYVARAVAGEAAPEMPRAALDALAIVARTFALASRGRHRGEGFDVCDLTHCLALGEPGASARQAARATAGRALRYRDRAAQVWLSASCGGRTATPGEIWPAAGQDLPYLISRAEADCQRASRWRAEIPERDLRRALRAAGLRGGVVRAVEVIARTASGRVARVGVPGFEPPEITAENFRIAVGRTLGWNLVRSHTFEITRTAAGFRFEGFGFGHGVGLCLTGAAGLAGLGRRADEILRAYFPGTTVAPPRTEERAPVALRLELPEADEGERPTLRALLDRSIDDLSRRTGLDAPPELRIRFHATVESFRRSSGRPWWIAGATRSARIELLPAPVLRQRGTLEATLRHELAHAFVDPLLADRPLWVREGAAMHFAGEHPEGAAPACPSDEDMRAVSVPDAMRRIYGRAAACFAREIAEGKSWREVGAERDL